VKDCADYICANATKIIASIYPVKTAARARYLQQTAQGRASSSGDTSTQLFSFFAIILNTIK